MSEAATRRALAATRQALSAVDEELDRHAEGQGRVSSAGQLTSLREQLARMELHLSAGPLPPRQQRVRGAGRVVVDSWPYDSALGGLILEAERLYLKA